MLSHSSFHARTAFACNLSCLLYYSSLFAVVPFLSIPMRSSKEGTGTRAVRCHLSIYSSRLLHMPCMWCLRSGRHIAVAVQQAALLSGAKPSPVPSIPHSNLSPAMTWKERIYACFLLIAPSGKGTSNKSHSSLYSHSDPPSSLHALSLHASLHYSGSFPQAFWAWDRQHAAVTGANITCVTFQHKILGK